jgi:hypothetical protein
MRFGFNRNEPERLSSYLCLPPSGQGTQPDTVSVPTLKWRKFFSQMVPTMFALCHGSQISSDVQITQRAVHM